MISRGLRFSRTTAQGRCQRFDVKALRYSPIPYAEVEPEGGGVRIQMSFTEVERCLAATPLPIEAVKRSRRKRARDDEHLQGLPGIPS